MVKYSPPVEGVTNNNRIFFPPKKCQGPGPGVAVIDGKPNANSVKLKGAQRKILVKLLDCQVRPDEKFS